MLHMFPVYYYKALFRMTYLQVLQRLSKIYKTSVYKSGQK